MTGSKLTQYLQSILLPILSLGILFITQKYSYLLFHTTAEMFSIIIAVSIFVFAWNTRKISQNGYFLFLGIAFLFLAILDFAHTLSYRGMNVFTGATADLPTQLWLAQRYLLAISLLLAPIFMKKRIKEKNIIGIFVTVTVLIFLSIFYFKNFPVSFREEVGLTTFKVYSEYLIAFIFFAATVVLFSVRKRFDRQVFLLLSSSFILNIATELFFTLYVGVYDIFNMLGHIFEVLAFYLVYKAIIQVGLTQPYSLLFLELKELDKKKDEFISLAGHEIKNPLTTIKLSSELLAHRLTKLKDRRSLNDAQQINIAADKINNLINDLLDVNRIESGRLKFVIEDLDFNDLAEEVVQSCRILSQKHRLILYRSKENVEIRGDRMRLGQVLMNLIVNAVKYSPPETKIIIRIAKDNQTATISVQDFGIGMTKSELPHVFNKYYRTAAGEKMGSGLGLGLYLAKEIVNLHRGKIWAESQKNQGSTFYFTLPIGRR